MTEETALAATGAEVLERQDAPLRLLMARRRMYRRAKRGNHPRVFGVGVLTKRLWALVLGDEFPS
jgi:hypothetical protein